MARPTSVSHLASEFDAFLFAPIGVDRNGMFLSVLSALARLDVDPWQEAATLARLPSATAMERLESVIAALPVNPAALEGSVMAARLIALLPRRASLNIASRQTRAGAQVRAKPSIVIYVISMVLALSLQFLIASRQQAVQSDDAHAPDSRTVFRQTVTLNPGQ